MTVNRMNAEQIPAVAALDAALFSGESWSRKDFEESLSDPSRAFWVAEEDGAFLGFCGLSFSFEQGDILNIGVEPSARKNGVGSALLQAAVEYFRAVGGKELFLEVRASNAAAKGLYEKFGFMPIGVRRGYYQQPAEDGLVYRLEV